MPETQREEARELERLQTEIAQLERERLEDGPPVIRSLARLLAELDTTKDGGRTDG